MPIPSNLDGQLYVPAGAAGIAMANLAARMGLETTGLTLPLARPAADVLPKDVRTKAVVSEDSALGKDVVQKLNTEETAGAAAETPLVSGEGELRVVDHAFNKQPAVLVRGDGAGFRCGSPATGGPVSESVGSRQAIRIASKSFVMICIVSFPCAPAWGRPLFLSIT